VGGLQHGDDGGGPLINPDGAAPARWSVCLALAHQGGPGKRAVKRMCVCVRGILTLS